MIKFIAVLALLVVASTSFAGEFKCVTASYSQVKNVFVNSFTLETAQSGPQAIVSIPNYLVFSKTYPVTLVEDQKMETQWTKCYLFSTTDPQLPQGEFCSGAVGNAQAYWNQWKARVAQSTTAFADAYTNGATWEGQGGIQAYECSPNLSH